MRKILGVCCSLMMICATTSARVGPLTESIKKNLTLSGAVYLQFNDYHLTHVMNTMVKKKKHSPSAVRLIVNNGKYGYVEHRCIGDYASNGAQAQLVKDNKYYLLNLNEKKGCLRSSKQALSANIVEDGGNVPTALGFLFPDTLKSKSMLMEQKMYSFQKSVEEIVDGKVYQCEIYGSSMAMLSNKVFKLYFLDGKPVLYSNGAEKTEILTIMNTVDDNIFNIPNGFIIYAMEQDDMSKLLRKEKIVEKY